MLNESMTQESQDPAHLARTLRRIKRRLLLEQCGVSLPYALQNRPQALQRSSSHDSGDTSDSTMRVAITKFQTSVVHIPSSSEEHLTEPSME